ncbi:MAG TPA: hypothetical protein VNB30_09615 [Rhizomicrobium sp.]|jgi:hypothetical protein|nr:hypothetical protein [Rhizomicrobium sp.]
MAQLGVKAAAAAVLALIGLALLFFGVGFLAYALATALAPSLGVAGGAAVTGAIFVVPPFFWAVIILSLRRPKPKPIVAPDSLWMALFAAIAKETPWVAIVGAGLVAAAEIFLSRNRSKK